MLRRQFVIAGVFVLAALLSVAAAMIAALRIESASARAVGAALADAGQGWATVGVDGLQVAIGGTAPDEATRFAALSTVAEIVATDRIRDATTVRPAQDIAPPRFTVEILRSATGISLIGLVPGEDARTRLLESLRRIDGGGPVTDLLDSAGDSMPAGWAASADYAARVLADLPQAKLTLSPGHVRVTALTGSPEEKRRLGTRLVRAAPEGVTVALDLRAPRPVVAPFSLRFVIDADGARFDSCTADTEAARTEIIEAVIAAGLVDKIDCTLGLGTPSPDWGRAVVAAIDTLVRMGGGILTFADADVALTAAPGADPVPFEAAVADLRSALPAPFVLTAQLPPDPAAADAPEFTATRSPEGMAQLRGLLPDAQVQTAVTALAAARLGTGGLQDSTELVDGLPEGWTLRVLAGIEALAQLETGSLRVQPQMITLRGTTGDPTTRARLTGLLTENLGEGAAFSLDITYERRLDPELNIPTPDQCIAEIGAVLENRQITFDPGSPNIDGAAGAVVSQIATILGKCEEVPMRIEIGGHTDSQGRDQMNLELSQARAEAVIDALLARGAPISGLIARGYGEIQPIADNDTEEGREANRRIEFRLLGQPDAAPEPDAESEADGAGPEARVTDAPLTTDSAMPQDPTEPTTDAPQEATGNGQD